MIEAKGLRLDERRQLAETIRERVRSGDVVVHVLLQPGDGTHYELVLARLGTRPFVGATYDRTGEWGPLVSTMGVPAVKLLAGHYWMLSWERHSAMLVDLSDGHYTDPSYVAEKMRLGGGSATIIAELVSMVAGADDATLASMRENWPVFDRVDGPTNGGEPLDPKVDTATCSVVVPSSGSSETVWNIPLDEVAAFAAEKRAQGYSVECRSRLTGETIPS